MLILDSFRHWRAIGVAGAATLLGLALLPSRPPRPEIVEVSIVEAQRCYDVFELPSDRARGADQLTQGDVVHGMAAVRLEVLSCYRGVPGLANVQLTIAGGDIASARVDGDFARTATGECIERAVRNASFRSVQEPLTVRYPFMLR